MTSLDIALILLCLAGIALIVYLIFMLTKVVTTVEKLNKMLDDNEQGIAGIVENLDAVTADARTLTGKATDVVDGVEKGLKKPLTADSVAGVVSSASNILSYSRYAIYFAGIISSLFGYVKSAGKKRKEKKERKAQRQEEKLFKKELRQQRKEQVRLEKQRKRKK